MSEKKVLVREDEGGKKARTKVLAPDVETAWKWIGWTGLVLAVVGAGDIALVWYPLNFGSPEWEFATVAQSFAGLPLVSIGLMGLLGAGLALGQRWVILGMGWGLLVGALGLIVALFVFLTDVPMALGATEGLAETGIKKAVFKTVMLGLVFAGAYAAAGVAALKYLKSNLGGQNA